MFATFIYCCPPCRLVFERLTLKFCLDHVIPLKESRLVRKFNEIAMKKIQYLQTYVLRMRMQTGSSLQLGVGRQNIGFPNTI